MVIFSRRAINYFGKIGKRVELGKFVFDSDCRDKWEELKFRVGVDNSLV